MAKRIWITKSGKKIRIKDMTTSHLYNTVKLLERKAKQYQQDLPYPCFQGEMAQIYADNEWDYITSKSIEDLCDLMYPAYTSLVKEYSKRT